MRGILFYIISFLFIFSSCKILTPVGKVKIYIVAENLGPFFCEVSINNILIFIDTISQRDVNGLYIVLNDIQTKRTVKIDFVAKNRFETYNSTSFFKRKNYIFIKYNPFKGTFDIIGLDSAPPLL